MLKRVLSAYGLGVFGAAAPCAAHVAALLGGVMLPAEVRAEAPAGFWCGNSPGVDCVYSSLDSRCNSYKGATINWYSVTWRPAGSWDQAWCELRGLDGDGVEQELGVRVYFQCSSGIGVPTGRCVETGEDFQNPPPDQECSLPWGGKTPFPVDVLTGTKRFSVTDAEIANSPLHLTRLYNSLPLTGADGSVIGPPEGLANWTFDFSYELQLLPTDVGSGIVTIVTPDGGAYKFQKQADGSMKAYRPANRPAPISGYSLRRITPWPTSAANVYYSVSEWELVDAEGRRWTLKSTADESGVHGRARPQQMIDAKGRALSFSYGSKNELLSVSDGNGNSASFTWQYENWAGGRPLVITKVSFGADFKINYSYDSQATVGVKPFRVSAVQYLDAANVEIDKISYAHADARWPTAITAVSDANAVKRWSVSYNSDGRVASSSGPNGADSYGMGYATSPSGFSRTVTNSFGKTATYTYSRTNAAIYDVKLTGVSGAASAHCPASAKSNTYGPDGFVSSSTDEEGRITTYTWNARGLPTQVTQGFGTPSARSVAITWHGSFRVPTKVVEPKMTTDYVYDTQGRPTSVTQTDTTTYMSPYATNGRTRTWSYAWNTGGQLLSVNGPLAGASDTRSWTYNAKGHLATATNEVGLVTTVTAWDWRGAPLNIVDANNVATTMAYDGRGRLLSATVNPGPNQAKYQFAYDVVGNLTKITLPKGGFLEYTYDDGRRLTKVANDRGETIDLTPNPVGQPTATETKAGGIITAQQSMVYDELGRLIQGVGGGGQAFSLGYDKVANVTSLTDGRGKVWGAAFDPLDRLISQTDPEAHVVRYAQDAADQMISHKDGRGLETALVVDGFGQVIAETSPDRGARAYWYDAAGRMTKLVDGDGEETDFTYDAAGRRTGMSFPGAGWETVTFGYDATGAGNKGRGRLTSVTEESGSSNFAYDEHGRITVDAKVIKGQSYSVAYAYDANGKIIQMTLPSGRLVTFTRAIDGLATAVSTKAPAGTVQSIANSVTYLPFGPVKQLAYGNGLTLTRTYDRNYWLTGTKVSATGVIPLDLTFQRNENGQLTNVIDNAATGRGAVFGYYDSGRLQYGVGPWGNHSYAYDAAGNRTDFRTDVGGVVAYEFAINSGASNQVTQVQDTNGAVLRNLIYRDGGDLYEDAHVGGSTYQFYYSARKRLVVVNKDAVDLAYYGYDFRNQRVSRQIMSPSYSSVHYIHDQQGHLIAEHNGDTGAAIKQYVWLDDMLLAVIDSSSGSEVLYYVHTGQLDEPLVMTNSAKSKVWDVSIEPFGQAQLLGTVSADLDLRLPGQWSQMESGLSQNWNRDYDPTLARYIQADPIGLAGGQNLYAYVDGRPLEWGDPTGECPMCVSAGIGAALGAGSDLAVQAMIHGADWGAYDLNSVLRSGIAGGVTGGLMMLPLGYTWGGAMLSGAIGGITGEMFNPDMTECSLFKAAAFGVLGSALGGPTKSLQPGRRPLPLHVTDFSLVWKQAAPQRPAAWIRAAGANLPGPIWDHGPK